MAKTIVIVGFGPGISTGVAKKFGSEGFSVALVARSEERLVAGVEMLKSEGITAVAIPADAGNPESIRAAIVKARAELGPIEVIHWNAYGGSEAGDLMKAAPADLRGIFDVAIFGLLAAITEALPDLKSAGDGAILITNGAFGETSPEMDQYAISLNSMGVALANGAKFKLVGLLSQRLKDEGVYVGEVMVAGMVKGTPWANGDTIEPSIIADKFWDLYKSRDVLRARIT